MADKTPLIDKIRTGVQSPQPDFRNPFSILFEKICAVGYVPSVSEKLQVKRPNVRIALVSMPTIPKAELEFQEFTSLIENSEPPPLDHDACKRQLVTFGKVFADKMLASFSEALKAALEDKGADIVCFSELGFPSLDMKPMMEAAEFAHEMSKKHDALIIAGSLHDARTLYNTGYLFYPGSKQHGHVFHKSISAVSVQELVSAPSYRRVPLVNIFGLKIAAMICLDVADYASIASVVRCADRVDVLLVPCYTPGFEKMAKIAKVTSEALGLVAMVNATLPEEPAGLHQIWRLGRKLEPPHQALPSGAAFVTYVDVDTEKLKGDRILKMTKENTTDWLFGSRNIPVVY
jgi:predicted amidohydrolase